MLNRLGRRHVAEIQICVALCVGIRRAAWDSPPLRANAYGGRNSLGRGAVFTADIYGGVPPQYTRSTFEVRGSEAWISLTSDHPYSFQAGDRKLTSNVAFAAPEEAWVSGGFMGAAINVGEVYAHLARDIRAGTYTTPGFDHALHDARLIDTVRRAAERGVRQKVTNARVC